VLDWPRHGCINIHASMLPRWRGAAPIQRAIEAGDRATGVSIIQMDAGLDTGPVVTAVEVPIVPGETGGTLHDKLAATGAAAMVATLGRLARERRLAAEPQPAAGATYAARIAGAETLVDWGEPADVIERRMRAFDPVPGLTATVAGQRVKLWAAQVLAGSASAPLGTVLAAGSEGIDVACRVGVLRILALQPASGRRMTASAFVAGRRPGPATMASPTA
jgi:methionyl-tRNA formyltransferase